MDGSEQLVADFARFASAARVRFGDVSTESLMGAFRKFGDDALSENFDWFVSREGHHAVVNKRS